MPRTTGMPCPLCGATTDVVLTRLNGSHYIRTRECFNEHVFKTKEVVLTEPRPKNKATHGKKNEATVRNK